MAINKNKILAAAKKYTAKGNLVKAIAEYQKILKAAPDDIRTWLKIGDLYARQGARNEAIKTYFKVAEQYTKSGFHLKAVAIYKQVLKIDSSLLEVFGYLADSYTKLGLISEALLNLEQLADGYQRRKKYDNMLTVLEKMATMDPVNIATRLRIAEFHSRQGDTEKAVEHFKIACDELDSQGRIEDLLKVSERLIYHDPSQVEIAYKAAKLYLGRGQFKRALARLQQCFVNDPKNVDTLELLAQAFAGLGQSDKSISVYKEMAALLGEKGLHERRKKVLEAILAINSKDNTALLELGRKPKQKDPSTAEIKDPKSSITPDNHEEFAAQIMSETDVLIKYKLYDKAAKHMDKLFARDKYNVEGREKIKDIYLEMGDTPHVLEQLFLLADVFKQNQPEGSIYYLHEILKIDSDNKRARDYISEIGGIMPEELEGGTIDQDEDLELIEEIEPIEVSNEPERIVSMDDIPFIPSDNVMTEDDLLGDYEDAVDFDDEDSTDFTDTEEEFTLSSEVSTPPVGSIALPRPSNFPRAISKPPSKIPVPVPSRPPLKPDRPVSSIPAPPEVKKLDELSGVSEDIEELEFFIEQELIDEAGPLAQELEAKYPDNERLQALLARLKQLSDSDESAEDARDSKSSYNPEKLADELQMEEIIHDDASIEVEEVFNQFKAEVKENVSAKDYATHFDLGYTYKEMGLFKDAIAEFNIASKDVNRAPDSKLMIGLCQIELEQLSEAESTFRAGLELPGLTTSGKKGFYYELGKLYEKQSEKNKALKCYTVILKADKEFADVKARYTSLKN